MQTTTVNGMIISIDPQMTSANPNVVVYKLAGMLTPSMGQGMMDLLNKNKDRYSAFIQAIQVAGLADTLQQSTNRAKYSSSYLAIRTMLILLY